MVMSASLKLMIFATIVAAIAGLAAIAVVIHMWRKNAKATGRKSGPGVCILFLVFGAGFIALAIWLGVHSYQAYDTYNTAKAAAKEKAKEQAETMLEYTEQVLPQIEQSLKDIIAQRQSAEAAEAAEAKKLENAAWPELDIDEDTYEEYRKYLDVAGRGTRSENAHNKEYIAQLNGYKCNDAVYVPLYMDEQYFNELNGIFPVEKYESLNDINLQSADDCDAHLKKEHAAQKEAWLALSDDERQDDVDYKISYNVVNDPVFGIGLFDTFCGDETWRKAYAEYYDRITELLDQAYGSGEGINYFLEYKDEEHALAHEEQYAGVTEEYFREIAVPMLKTLETGFTPNKRLEKRRTSMNLCLPYVLKDSLVRLQPADYQEERTFVTYSHYGKDDNEHMIVGFNIDDRRFAKFARKSNVEVAVDKGSAPPPKGNIKKSENKQSDSTIGESDNPDNPDNPPDDTPDDTPKTKVEKEPDKEPTQTETGGDQNGGDNKGSENGGDQNHDEAKNEEQQDTENNNNNNDGNSGDNSSSDGDSGEGSGEGTGNGETVHDPGANTTPPEDKGSQNGDGGSLGGTVSTGTV